MIWRPGKGSTLDAIETRLVRETADGDRVWKVWPAKLPEPHNASQWHGSTLRWCGYEPLQDEEAA